MQARICLQPLVYIVLAFIFKGSGLGAYRRVDRTAVLSQALMAAAQFIGKKKLSYGATGAERGIVFVQR